PRDLGPALGGEAGRLLVAHVDHPDAAPLGAQVQAPDVAAVEREDRRAARLRERLRDQVAGRDGVGHQPVRCAHAMNGVLWAAAGWPAASTRITPPEPSTWLARCPTIARAVCSAVWPRPSISTATW